MLGGREKAGGGVDVKSVLFSVRPEWCYKIASGEKTIEVRKTAPKLPTPYKSYLYCTKRQKPVLINLQNLPETPYIITAGDHSRKYELPDMDWARLCNGKVWAEFICDADLPLLVSCSDPAAMVTHYEVPGTCLSDVEIMKYLGNGVEGHGLHISELTIYDRPRKICEFKKAGACPYLTKDGCKYPYHCFRAGQLERCGGYLDLAPQSWCYVEEML